MPKVSVIIPVYNVEEYLRECLESVINQTLKDIEIICVDDGSTDGSPIILDEYAARDNRIKVFHKENGGYGKAMNFGIDNSTGEYIGIVEPDDYIESEMYATLYEKAKENDVDFVKSDFYRFMSVGDNVKIKRNNLDSLNKNHEYYNKIINLQEDSTPFLFRMNTWSGIYKREFIEKYHIRHNETPGASFQDNGFWFQTFMFAKTAYFVDTPFYMNRRDNPNSSVKSKEKVYAMKNEYDFIRDILKNNPETEKRLIGIYWYKRIIAHFWTLKRIDSSYIKEYIQVVKKDLYYAVKNNLLDYNLFQDRYKYLIKLLLNKNAFERKISLYMSFCDKIFSVKETFNGDRVIITVLGLKIKYRKHERG